jgi:hypothetical protein
MMIHPTLEADICDYLPELVVHHVQSTGLHALADEGVTADFMCEHRISLNFVRRLVERDTSPGGMERKHSLYDVLTQLGATKMEHVANRSFFDPIKVSNMALRQQSRLLAAFVHHQQHRQQQHDFEEENDNDGSGMCTILEQIELALGRRLDVRRDLLEQPQLSWTVDDLVAMGVDFCALYKRGMRSLTLFKLVSQRMHVSLEHWGQRLGMVRRHTDLLRDQ